MSFNKHDAINLHCSLGSVGFVWGVTGRLKSIKSWENEWDLVERRTIEQRSTFNPVNSIISNKFVKEKIGPVHYILDF